MGGQVFSSGPAALLTPRMCTQVYEHVKGTCIGALRGIFVRVESPIEAPEKKSHGDIDIFVPLEGSTFDPQEKHDPRHPKVWTAIETALKAVRTRHSVEGKEKAVVAKSIAIRWPAALNAREQSSHKVAELALAAIAGEAASLKPRYIQVDIRLCTDLHDLEWRLFKHAHGDIWNMLGSTIRPFGLTIDDVGLNIRIPEIERENKKKARVLLTSKPTEVLDFLGLTYNNGEWDRPFDSVDNLFEYAASCRYFMLWPHDSAATRVKSLKSNDRQRMSRRPVFARWEDDFIPACIAKGRFVVDDPRRTRAVVHGEVRAAAFATFPHAEAAYSARLAEWVRDRTRIFVKSKVIKGHLCVPEDISHVLPAPQEGGSGTLDDINIGWRGALRSALTDILIYDSDDIDGITPPRLRDEAGLLRVDDIKEWIVANWEEVGRVAWRRQCARAAEEMRAKEEEERKTAEEAAAAAASAGVPSSA